MSGGSDLNRWCILRTSGPKTVKLTQSLGEAGFSAWTPVARTKYPALKTRPAVERDLPIMPTFVFADARHVVELAHLAADRQQRRHPLFSLMRLADRVPLVGERDMQSLRAAEADAAQEFANARDAEVRLVRRRERAETMRTQAARRRALKSQRLGLGVGTWVEVTEPAALMGLPGQIVTAKNNTALVCFGGSLIMEIDAWRLLPSDVEGGSTSAA